MDLEEIRDEFTRDNPEVEWTPEISRALEDATFYPEYANPGFDSGIGVVVADWNVLPRGFDSAVEQAGYVIDWQDEIVCCDDCARAIHTTPQYYGDTPSYAILGDCNVLCADCLKDTSAAEYLESLENQPRRAVNVRGFEDETLAEYGYRKVSSGYENGWHPGQDDNPAKILSALKAANPAHRFIFKLDGAGQFDVKFSVWQKVPEGD